MTIHCDPIRRLFPAALQISRIGYLPDKTYAVRHSFRTCNFSFILRGQGSYRVRGEPISVRAPAVLTQWPGEPCDYGPDANGWSELYLLYPDTARVAIQAMGLHPPGRKLWHLDGLTGMQPLVSALLELLPQAGAEGAIDRIDRLGERLIVESLLHARDDHSPRGAVDTVRAHVEAHLHTAHDFDRLAREIGLSPTHFRRLWRQQLGQPPVAWLNRQRIQRAARDLVEGEDAIRSIAQRYGFEDPLYFTRRFRRELGISPSAYRRRHAHAWSRLPARV